MNEQQSVGRGVVDGVVRKANVGKLNSGHDHTVRGMLNCTSETQYLAKRPHTAD